MTTFDVNYSRNIDTLGNRFLCPIDGTRTLGHSENGQNWTVTGNVLPTGTPNWTGWDTSDDGLTVMVAANGTCVASLAPWISTSILSASSLPAGAAWKKCVFGGGSFVSVNTSTTTAAYMRPRSGVAWTASTLPSASAWALLAYGNNTFVTIAPSSTSAAYSTDSGQTWTASTLPASLTWVDLKFSNGYFVLIASNSQNAYTSADGITWNVYTNVLPAGTWKQLAWANVGGANGTWVTVPSTGTTGAYSTDNGQTWTASTLPASANWIVTGDAAAWDGIPMFTALTVNTTSAAYSYNGVTWSPLTITAAAFSNELRTVRSKVATGDNVLVKNGATLTINTNQDKYLAGATALQVISGKVAISNSSTSTPIRVGTGKISSAAVLTAIDCVNGLGSLEVDGDWIEIGTSTGASNQTMTSPYTHGDYVPAVWVETAAGSGVYEPWANISNAPAYNQYNYFRNGFRAVGKDGGGTVFTQDFNQPGCQYLNLSNTNAIQNTNVVVCASTAGLVPGTWVYSRSTAFLTGAQLPGTGVIVQEIIDSTKFTVNMVFPIAASSSAAGYSNIPMIAVLPVYNQHTTTLRFGDGVNGKIPPTGAKIRVPNIMLTDYSSAIFASAFSSTSAPFHLRSSSGGGSFSLDTCLMDESYSNLTQASIAAFANVGFSHVPFISECYQASFVNCATALPPHRHLLGAATALGATGSTNSTTTITTPATNALIPGVFVYGTNLHACTVSSVTNNTTATVSAAAFGTSGTIAFSYMGLWAPREHRMLLATGASFGSTLTNAPWTYVSNLNIEGMLMVFGGHGINGANTNPGIGSSYAGLLGLSYSNNVVVNGIKCIQVGSYPKTRPYNTAFAPTISGTNHSYVDVELYNINGLLGQNITNTTNIANVVHRPGINNEGYNWASACRVFADPGNETYLTDGVKYWFKTRSYKTHNYHDTTGYVDSMPYCAVQSITDKYKQMPHRAAVIPAWSTAVAPAIAYGNGSWVFLNGAIAAGANTAMVSDDNGATWTAYQMPVTNTTASVYWKDIIYCPTQGYFMAIGGGAANQLFAYSTNGKDWATSSSIPASAVWMKLAFDNSQPTNKWVAVSGGSAVSTAGTRASISGGALSFTATTLASAQWVDVVSNDAGRYVAIAGGTAAGTATAYSTDGATWTAGGANASSKWQSIAYGAGRFVCVSASSTTGPTAYSTDATSWTASIAPALPAGNAYTKILWTGTVFVLLAGPEYSITSHTVPTITQTSRYFATSIDGITWSALKTLPDHSQWVAMANNGNSVGILSTQTGRFAYTADISVATPTWTLYTGVMPVWNRISLFHQSTEYTTALATATSVSTTAGSTTVTCASTGTMQVGLVMTLNTGNTVATGAVYLGTGAAATQTNAVIVTSIVDGTTFTINKPALKTASGMTATFYKHVYQIYRSTTPGFTARDETTLIGSTASITAGQNFYDDTHGVTKDTAYHYRIRKLSGGGAASIANCSGTAGTTTITTQGSWYYWQGSFEMEGTSGTNVLTSLAVNFFANGIIPGTVVSGPGIPAGTTVTAVPDFDTIILSANLTSNVSARGTNRTWVGFSPAPGMYVFGSTVGMDCKVVSIDSATSMTVSVNNTNTFSNRTLRFVVGEELPEITSIPTAPVIIQNNALQSTTLATTWTASGVTATNAATLCPLDNFVGINAAAPGATGCTVLATAANGTLTQTIPVGVGQMYTFSCYARARHPDLRNYIQMKMDLGSVSETKNLTNQWTRYAVSFTTTADTANAVFTLPDMGTVVEIAQAMVTLGNDIPCPTPATTTNISYFAPQQVFAFTDGVAGHFTYGGPHGIVTNLQTAPTGTHFSHLHVGTSHTFTITDVNQAYSTETSAVSADCIVGVVGGASTVVVDNYQPINPYVVGRNVLLNLQAGSSNVSIKNSKIALNGSTGNLLAFSGSGDNVYFHDITIIHPRSYLTTGYLDALTTPINNASGGIKYQNVKVVGSGRLPWGNQSRDTIWKGAPGCDSAPAAAATTWNLNTNPTQDGLPSATASLASVYDSMFHEMTWGSTTNGCLDVRMIQSSNPQKPYTVISGSPYFDNAGGLYFTTLSDQIVIEWPHMIKGVTGFSKRMPHIYGVDIGLSPVTGLGVLVEYDIDKGSGYSNVWKRVNSTAGVNNLAAETGISASTGFKIKFRLSARSTLKYTGQTAQFPMSGTIRNALLPSGASTAVVIDDEAVTATTGSLVCSSITGTWATGDTIYSGTLTDTITATTANATATMTGSTISGTTMTVGTLSAGTIEVGMLITGTGVTAGTHIVGNIAGSGSGSTWTVNFPQGVVSTTLTGTSNKVTIGNTANVFPGMGFRVATTVGGLTAGTTYFVLGIVNSTQFNVTTASYGNTAATITGTTGQNVTMVGVHGTITPTNTVGVFAPQPTSKIQAIRIFTNTDTTSGNNYSFSSPTLSLTGTRAGSEIRVYRTDTMAELMGTENSTGTSFSGQYEYSSDINAIIVIHHLDYLPIRLENQVLGANGVTIPIQQTKDRQYLNP